MDLFFVKTRIEDCKLIASAIQDYLDNNDLGSKNSIPAATLNALAFTLRNELNTLYDSLE